MDVALKKKLQKVFTTTQATEFKRQFKVWWPNRGVLEKLSATLCKISLGIAGRSDGNPFRVFLEDQKFLDAQKVFAHFAIAQNATRDCKRGAPVGRQPLLDAAARCEAVKNSTLTAKFDLLLKGKLCSL